MSSLVFCEKVLKSNTLTTFISMPRASNRKRARKRARQEKEQNELPTIYPHDQLLPELSCL
jgi:hypothetical protein